MAMRAFGISAAPSAWAAVAEAEQREGGGADAVGPDRERRDADPAADEDRAPPLARRAEAAAERPEHEELVAGLELAQAVGPGPDVLEQEVERPVLVRPEHAERARQERPLVGAAAPALRRGEHVELAGVGGRPLGIGDREDAVRPVVPASNDACRAASEGRQRPLIRGGAARDRMATISSPSHLHARFKTDVHDPAATPRACSSWSETTAGSPRRSAAIARVAAIPPAIVVMHGIPRPTAARRIS